MMSTSGWVWTKRRVSFLSVSRRFSRASTASAKRASRSSACAMRVQFEQRPQKSGKPSLLVPPPVTGCSRQFMARASIRARVYLPDPCAPERMTACGKRLRASISRRRWMVSGLPWKSENGIENKHSCRDGACPVSVCARHVRNGRRGKPRLYGELDLQLLPHQLHDNRMCFAGRASGVYHVDSVRLAGCDGQVRMADTPEKGPAFLLKTVLVSFRAFIRPGAFVPSIATAGALDAECHFVVEHDREVGLQVAAEDFVHLQNGLRA